MSKTRRVYTVTVRFFDPMTELVHTCRAKEDNYTVSYLGKGKWRFDRVDEKTFDNLWKVAQKCWINFVDIEEVGDKE